MKVRSIPFRASIQPKLQFRNLLKLYTSYIFYNSSMISMEYCATSLFTFILSSSWKLASIFPSSDTSFTWGHKNTPTLEIKLDTSTLFGHARTFFTFILLCFYPSENIIFQPLRPKVTWDLTKMWRLINKPLASGVITSTVKWASNSRHIQSIICQPNKMEKGQWNESKSKPNIHYFSRISKISGEIEVWGKTFHLWAGLNVLCQQRPL